MKYILIFAIVGASIFSKSSAQSLNETKISEATSMIRFYYTFNKTTNNNHAYVPFRKVPFKTMGFDIEFYDFEQGRSRYYLYSKVIDDMLWLIGATIRGIEDEDYCNHSTALSFKYGYNLFSTSKLNISGGFSLTDYMIILPEVNSTGASLGGNIEPNGWYWAAGPNIFIDYHIFDSFTIHANFNYDFSFLGLGKGKGTQVIDGYKKPTFLGTRLSINHDIGFFVQYMNVFAFDRGVHNQNINRREIQLGYRFLLGR